MNLVTGHLAEADGADRINKKGDPIVTEVSLTREERLRGREAILAILARAAKDSQFLADMANNPGATLDMNYVLTSEELAALASGDIKKIESWVGKLDNQHATWLWCRLCQERW